MDFKLSKSNLNFRVYTASATPSAGEENDICVISNVPMKNWVLSPDAPRGAPRNDGDVWIRYSVSGNTFNALYGSVLSIAFISAMQYIDGEWVGMEAKRYHNGEWIFTLIDRKATSVDFVTSGSGAVSVGNDHMYFRTDAKDKALYYATKEKYDLTPYRKITMEFYDCGPTTDCEIKLSVATDIGSESTIVASTKVFNTAEGIAELDISNLSGQYYIEVSVYSYSYVGYGKVTRLEAM